MCGGFLKFSGFVVWFAVWELYDFGGLRVTDRVVRTSFLGPCLRSRARAFFGACDIVLGFAVVLFRLIDVCPVVLNSHSQCACEGVFFLF